MTDTPDQAGNLEAQDATSVALNQQPDIAQAKGFIFDMDGVLYRGTEPLPGVADVMNALTLRGIPYLLATNNSMSTQQAYVDRLARMGVMVDADDIQTSATATRDFLSDFLPEGARIQVVGMPPLSEQLFDGSTFEPADDPATDVTADAVVVGLDLEFTYEKLRHASDAVRAGAKFVATNADGTLPNENGLQPGAGSIVAAIEKASGVVPVVVGKPEPLMIQKGVDRLGVAPEETVMVGDRLDTDILAGERAGTMTALVLTGISGREDLADAEALPDFIFPDLNGLLAAIVGAP